MPAVHPAWMSRWAITLLGLALTVGLMASQPSPSIASPVYPPEPAAAAAFIDSQRTGNVAEAERVTSPLYRAEMVRRGRGSAWPLDGLWVEATAQLSFTYVAAVSDSRGFTYVLYTARPRYPTGQASPTSLWRIDLDPQGKVIWGDLARIFESPQVEVIRGQGLAGTPSVLARSWVAPTSVVPLQVVLEVRSAAGDAYVALRPDPTDPGRIAFVQQDTSGDIGPSYWSFGEPVPAEVVTVQPGASGVYGYDGLTDAQTQTLRFYLEELAWSPAS